jgi:hypothetical protein
MQLNTLGCNVLTENSTASAKSTPWVSFRSLIWDLMYILADRYDLYFFGLSQKSVNRLFGKLFV